MVRCPTEHPGRWLCLGNTVRAEDEDASICTVRSRKDWAVCRSRLTPEPGTELIQLPPTS